MKIAIIGPSCSGKSTLAEDLARQHANFECHEEPVRVFQDQGREIGLSGASKKGEKLELLEFSITRLTDEASELDPDKDHILLGSPIEEFMYMVYPVQHACADTDIDSDFLDELAPQVKEAMSAFDCIFRVVDFEEIDYEHDGHRPPLNKSFRRDIDAILSDLLTGATPWDVIDKTSPRLNIIDIKGNRAERVRSVAEHIAQLKSREPEPLLSMRC
jgi:AAA domain